MDSEACERDEIPNDIIAVSWHELTRLVTSFRVCRPSVGISFTIAAVGRTR